MQPLAGQPQTARGTLLKKSYLKDYGRFFVFLHPCNNRAMNDENVIANGNENAGPTECLLQPLPDSKGRDAALRRPGQRSGPTLPGSETPVETDETQTSQPSSAANCTKEIARPNAASGSKRRNTETGCWKSCSRRNRTTRKSKGGTRRPSDESKRSSASIKSQEFRLLPLTSG
jgi:hypothetical protein